MVAFLKRRRFVRSKRFVKRRAVGPTLQQKVIRPEVKAVDVIATTNVSSTQFIAELNQLSAGTESYNRIGKQVQMHSLRFVGSFSLFPRNAVQETIRVALIYDRQPNGSAPSWADIFTSVDNTGATTSIPWSMPNVANLDRFKVLADFHFNPVPAPIGAIAVPSYLSDGNQKFMMDRYVKLGGLEARYNAGSPNAISGALFLVALSTEPAATAPTNLTYYTRVTYTDQ